MTTLWDDNEAKKYKTDLDLRVYTSRLLGQYSSLVLHGGGNTSVKSNAKNLFEETENILYVKGSGWDLATIESEGFAQLNGYVTQNGKQHIEELYGDKVLIIPYIMPGFVLAKLDSLSFNWIK